MPVCLEPVSAAVGAAVSALRGGCCAQVHWAAESNKATAPALIGVIAFIGVLRTGMRFQHRPKTLSKRFHAAALRSSVSVRTAFRSFIQRNERRGVLKYPRRCRYRRTCGHVDPECVPARAPPAGTRARA